MRRNRLFLLVAVSLVALLMVSGCATKKFVRQEITTSETKTNQKIDQETAKLSGQINELSALNKQLSSRIEQVSDRASSADAKAEEAKGIGLDAKKDAQAANAGVNDLRTKFDNRNNYTLVDTKSVYFGFNKADLTAEAKATLDEVARQVAGNKNAVLTLEGYTDSIGDDQYNIALSEKRVKNVVRYFVGEKNYDLNRLYVIGMGKSNPIADNKTADGRKQNRRVTVKILEAR
jgi:outer membrane protein OmpA-like peptidoglycan-associated protein